MKNFRQLMGKNLFTLLSAALLYSLGSWQVVQGQNHPNGIDFIGPDGVTYPDFTFAGLEGGNQIPNVPTVTTVDASGSDDYQTVVDAINDLPREGGAILLKNGTYFINRPIEIRRDNVVIRGESRKNTIIRTDGGRGDLFRFQGSLTNNRGGFTNDWDRGDKTIDISGSGISVQPGDYLRLVINQGLPPEHRFRFKNQGRSGIHPEDYRGIYQGEWEITIKKVVAVNGNLVTFLVPMRTRYRSAWGGEAQIRKDQFVRNNGVENLTIDNTNGGMNSFKMEAAANCWIKNVHVEKTQSHPIDWGYPLGGKNCLIEDCTFDGAKNTGGGGNGYFGFIYSHDCMYRRVQTYGMRHGPNIQSFSSGNVFLDCYSYSSNAEMHSRFARHNLIDRCTTNMENTWTEAGWKTTRLDQIDNGHDPAGGRHVLFNSYFYNIGATAIHAGGFNRDDVYAYNKWQAEGRELNDVLGNYTVQLFDFSDNLTIIGNKFANDEQNPSYDYTEGGSTPFPGERRQGTLPYAAVMFLPGYKSGGGTETDPSKYGQTGVGWQRESASASDIVPGWGTSYQSTPVIPFARQYAQTNGTANNGYPLPQSPIMQGTGVTPHDIPQIHFINNTFYGHDPATVPMFAGYNRPATNRGNIMVADVPDMDMVTTTPFASSLYEWQMVTKGEGGNNDGGRGGAFPVELIRFNAEGQGAGIQLEWETATEQNSSHFVVERSLDAYAFEAIESMPSNGNSNTLKRYDHFDSNVQRGVDYYYRLRMVDLDGTFEYSNVLNVRLDAQARIQVKAYPNPAQEQINLKLSNFREAAPETDKLVLKVFNHIGQAVYQRELSLSANAEETLTLSLNGWQTGIYYASFNGAHGILGSTTFKVQE